MSLLLEQDIFAAWFRTYICQMVILTKWQLKWTIIWFIGGEIQLSLSQKSNLPPTFLVPTHARNTRYVGTGKLLWSRWESVTSEEDLNPQPLNIKVESTPIVVLRSICLKSPMINPKVRAMCVCLIKWDAGTWRVLLSRWENLTPEGDLNPQPLKHWPGTPTSKPSKIPGLSVCACVCVCVCVCAYLSTHVHIH